MSLSKLLFIGMPGAGKGTQAKLLLPYGFEQISTGDIIREAWKREDPLVMPYKAHIEEGGFLPDDRIFQLIDKAIGDLTETGYILDGAIRNIPQAEMALRRDLVDGVLFFDLTEPEAISRLGRRFKIEGRKDDGPNAVMKRLEKYRRETKPVPEYFGRNRIPVYRIDASPSIEEIHTEVVKILGLK